MQPTKAKGFWKYETDSLRLFQPGAEIIYDYDTDSRVGITGTQNRVILRGPKFQTQGERVNVIFPGSDINDNRESIQWVPTKSTTTIDDAGGIDANDTSVIVNKPANAAQFTPDNLRSAAVKIDDEYVVITSIALSVPDGSHDTWTIKRARHGTTAAAHGDGDTCRLYRTFPDMGMIALTSSNVALDVPTALSATAYAGYIDVSWTHGLTDTEIKQLHSFILYYSDTTIGTFDPNVDALPGGVTRLELSKSPRHIFADTTYVEKFFKVTSMNLSGVESALSAEDSATATQPPDPVVNAKPDPPTIGMVGDGGNQETGFLFFISVQVSGSAGDAGVVKLEYQIGDHDASFTAAGDPPTGGFTPITTNRLGGDIYELQAGKEFAGLVAVPYSSAAEGGQYKLTARVFNSAGGGWSDWKTPVTASTVGGIPDLGAPGTTDAIFRVINTPETDGGAGNNVTFEIGLPSANGKTIYGYEIQGVLNGADWTADLPGNLGLLDSLATGTGDIVDGGIIVSNISPGLVASAHVGDVIVVYETADISGGGEGEITGLVGNNLITANATTTVTVKPPGGVGYKKTKAAMKFIIATGQDYYDFRVEDNLPQFGGIAERVGDIYRVSHKVSGVFKYRIRFFGPETRSAWWYHETGTDGTGTKASADFFTPSKLVGTAAIAPLTVSGAEVAAFTLDLDDKSVSNSLSALILAHASKPPTVNSGAPSGAPGANESDFYLRDDTTPLTMYWWTGALWTTDRSLWSIAAQAEAYQVVGHLTAGAVTAGAMVVTGILDATHIVAAGLDLAAGQDFQLYLADANPSEIRFGTDGGGQFGGHIFAQATGANTYFSPQVNGSGFLNLGGASSHFGEENWDQIALNAKAAGSGIVTLNATDSTSGFVKQLLMNATGVFMGFYDAGSLFTGCEYTDNSAVFKADNVAIVSLTSTSATISQDTAFQGEVTIDGETRINHTVDRYAARLSVAGSAVFSTGSPPSANESFGAITALDSGNVVRIQAGSIGTGSSGQGNPTLDFYIGAAVRATFLTDGNFGLGIAVPSYPLHVKSDIGHKGISIEENSGTEAWQLGVNAAGDLGFHNSGSGTATVVFLDDGKVGIGTASPLANLHVVGASAADGVINIETTGGAVSANWAILANTATGRLTIGEVGGTTPFKFATTADENLVKMGITTTDLFQVTGRLSVSNSVGIGTTSPGEELEVNGNILVAGGAGESNILFNASGTTRFPGLVFNDSTTGAGGLISHKYLDAQIAYGQSWLFNAYATGNQAADDLKRVRSSYVPSRLTTDVHQGGGLSWWTASTGSADSDITSWTNRFTVATSGNFSIGTTGPQTNLHVSESNTNTVPAVEIEQLSEVLPIRRTERRQN